MAAFPSLKTAFLLFSLLTAIDHCASRYTLERDPKLLVRKHITTDFLVENRDFEIQYDLYNIGNTMAINVRLVDDSFHPQLFQLISGQFVAEFDRILPHSNVSHAVVMRAKRPGFFRFTSAEIKYQNEEKTWTRSSLSSEPGEAQVMAAGEYAKKKSTKLWKWLGCLVLAAPFVVMPYMAYKDIGKRRFENRKRKYR